MRINAPYALAQIISAPENSQFPGVRSAISGLRYYSPGTGRWLSRDPVEEQGGENLYGFIANNALSAIDPKGLAKFSVTFPLFPGIVFRGSGEIAISNEGCCKRTKIEMAAEVGIGAGAGAEVGNVAGINIAAMLAGIGRKESLEILHCPTDSVVKHEQQLVNITKFLNQSATVGNSTTKIYGGAKFNWNIEFAVLVRTVVTQKSLDVTLLGTGSIKVTGGAALKLWTISLGQSGPDEVIYSKKYPEIVFANASALF